jgi:hypothetical protein
VDVARNSSRDDIFLPGRARGWSWSSILARRGHQETPHATTNAIHHTIRLFLVLLWSWSSILARRGHQETPQSNRDNAMPWYAA